MVDILFDTKNWPPDGVTVSLSDFKGSGRLEEGRIIAVGVKDTEAALWEVLRVDVEDNALHLVRTDRVIKLKEEHSKLGLSPNGSVSRLK